MSNLIFQISGIVLLSPTGLSVSLRPLHCSKCTQK